MFFLNQTRAVDKIRPIKKSGHLPEELMDRVNKALMKKAWGQA